MKRSLRISRSAALLAVVAALGAAGARQGAPAQLAHAASTFCAATGVYTVGQPLTSIKPGKPGLAAPQETGGPVQGPAAYAMRAAPRGTLVVLSYTGCGSATSGAFSVRFGARPLHMIARKGAVSPMGIAVREETLSGTFAEATGVAAGSASAATSSTVAVKATLTVAAPESASGAQNTTTSAKMDVMGSLQVSPESHTAVLTFAQSGDSALKGFVIYGHRGLDRPITGG